MEKITKSSDKVLIDPNEPLILPDGTALVGRLEWFLYALCCLDYQNLPTPMSRIEEFANALITGEVPNIEPQSRAEQFFLAILDGNISDLPQPQSRSEVLLDKLARGEFDLSDVEPIQSRYELLLAYLIKNGGIGNIDYVLYEFSEAMKTMYNTVEKPFKSLELSGNTLVNCVLEDTENDDYTSFDKDYSGTSFTINGTSEGAIKSAILSGQTLVNLLETKKEKYTFNNQQNWIVEDGYLKCNGTSSWHTVTDKFNDMIKPSTKYLLRIEIVENTLGMVLNFDGYGTNILQTSAFLAFGVNEVGVKSYIVTTSPGLDSTKNGLFRLPINITNDGTLKIRFMTIEYQEGMENWDIPYFTGMQSVKMPVLTTSNEDGTKTNILTVNEDVTLRGIGNVQDTLDLLTGEVISNFETLIIDGTENWYKTSNETELTIRYRCDNIGVSILNNNMCICDNYSVGDNMSGDGLTVSFNGKILTYRVLKSKFPTLEDFKKWLNDNHHTFIYQVEKSVKTVDLNVVDQNNNKIDKIHVFNEVTHVNASSDELTPTVNIGKSVSYPTIIKPNTKYTVDLKRNDKPLTVNLGGTEVTFTDGETRKTITTPSTLTNDKLSYYGVGAKCNEIMLIEGEVEGNVDYFTGMQSVVMQNQMPILSTTGKNLLPSIKNTWYPCRFKQGTTFKLSTRDSVPSNGGNVVFKDINGASVWFGIDSGNTTSTKVLPCDVYYIMNSLATGVEHQLEIGTQVTSYEPNKTSILSCNEEVTLRGIGDVQDTLDCLTGEVVQNIYEFILDGSQDIDNDGNLLYYYLPLGVHNNRSSSDKLPSITVGQILDGLIGVAPQNRGNASRVYINVNGITTKEEMKNFFLNNPTTIQCVLTEKSARTVDLNVVDKDGNAIPKIKSYKDVTHLEVTVPKQSLLPNISAEVATDNSKDMSSLAEKHQEISEAQSVIQNSIQSQSDEIDTALMATTEIFESILE